MSEEKLEKTMKKIMKIYVDFAPDFIEKLEEEFP